MLLYGLIINGPAIQSYYIKKYLTHLHKVLYLEFGNSSWILDGVGFGWEWKENKCESVWCWAVSEVISSSNVMIIRP